MPYVDEGWVRAGMWSSEWVGPLLSEGRLADSCPRKPWSMSVLEPVVKRGL